MSMKNVLTILTPTYNRCDKLTCLYNSLNKQTNKNFEWIIVDDGSTDGTKAQIDSFILENTMSIKYFYKPNGGKHTALNVGIDLVTSFLTFIVDSDDILTSDAVETIIQDSKRIKNQRYCGLSYLRGYPNGAIIGDQYSHDGFYNWNKMRFIDNIKGDKAEVWKTEYMKKIKFPEFANEKFLGENYLWCQLSEKFDMYFKNKIIYITEYLDGGLSKSGRKLRISCPNGGMASTNLQIKKVYPFKIRLKNTILFVTYAFFSKTRTKDILSKCESKYLAFISLPISYALYKKWYNNYIKKSGDV